MTKPLIFVGGVHGSGKSTLSNNVAQHLGYAHVSASELIKSRRAESAIAEKTVDSVEINQDLLTRAYDALEINEPAALMDGHFCLWGAGYSVQRVPGSVFAHLSPRLIFVLTDHPDTIAVNLERRDGVRLPSQWLEELQKAEVAHAEEVGRQLSAPVFILTQPASIIEVCSRIRVTLEGQS